METDRKELLRLDTLITRPQVIIDGQPFEMIAEAEMSIVERQRQAARGRRIMALMSKDTTPLTDKEEAELTRLLDEACRAMLVDVPEELYAKLRDGHRLALVEAFGRLLQETRRPAGAEKQTASRGAS
jgi:hypothetical protein